MGVAVSGMHYTGMAAMHIFPPGAGGGMAMAGSGATAETFLLPLLIGISILAFIMTATLALSPTDEEIRADAALLERIEAAQGSRDGQPIPVGAVMPAAAVRRPGTAISRAAQARRQAQREEPYSPQ
jgi:hypothetical protein